jgi:hypothetical protein
MADDYERQGKNEKIGHSASDLPWIQKDDECLKLAQMKLILFNSSLSEYLIINNKAPS